jgi:hypothetical protein
MFDLAPEFIECQHPGALRFQQQVELLLEARVHARI